MILYPNCKINIGLRVVRKREDGYHDLETIFYPVYGLSDVLEITPREDNELHFQQRGICVDCASDDNLIVRCYRMMQQQFGSQVGGVDICLDKRIPFGAGLGGGSSDAAHTAIAINELFQLGLNQTQLAQLVRPLGADCPFFVYNTPCFATGIGDVLTPIDIDLKGKRLVMIKPAVGVSTRDAYAGIQPYEVPFDQRVNDFEKTVFARYPQLAAIKQQLLDAGATYAAMSGSGSTIFGLFDQDTERGAMSQRGTLDKDLAPMVIFDDTL